MRFRSYKNKWQRTLFFVLGVPAVLYFVWASGHVVIAYQEVKRAHILPTQVDANGWSAPDNAMTHDLPPTAPFASFTKDNSAYIVIEGAPPVPHTQAQGAPTTPEPSSIASSTPDETASSSTSILAPPTTDASSTPVQPIPLPLPEIMSPTLQSPTSSSDASGSAPKQSTPAPVSAPRDSNTQPAPVPAVSAPGQTAPASQEPGPSAPTSMIERIEPIVAEKIKKVGSFIFSQMVATAFATSTDTS